MDLSRLSLSTSFPSAGATPGDPLSIQLRQQAAGMSKRQLNALKSAPLDTHKHQLKRRIIEHAGVQFFPDLPLLLKETKRTRLSGMEIAAIRFQTLPGVFATASLYIPDGDGPFPGIVLTHGHWAGGRNSDLFQEVAQCIAHHGYVCLTIDAWGAGERSTTQGKAEYHGSNLGASLLNVGQTLMGLQVTENIRAVDLLSTLPMVDGAKIGATGASGGGNQAMWLAAVDERIKAVVPVVSVGTFQSYVMNSNCVCELLPSGLTFTEEAGVLGLIAPRALRMINAKQETNPAFTPQEMLCSYRHALPVFEGLDAGSHIDYKLVDSGHGFDQAMQEAMIAWFDAHLCTEQANLISAFVPEVLPADKLATYDDGKREKEVLSTAEFCSLEGQRLRNSVVNEPIDVDDKRRILKQLLGLPDYTIQRIDEASQREGWEVTELHMSPDISMSPLSVAFQRPADKTMGYTLLVHGQGTANLPDGAISDVLETGRGVVLVDLWGTGARTSREATQIDGALSPHHTLARSSLWLGQTMMGRWAGELLCVMQWIQSMIPQTDIHLVGFREAGLATLYAAVFEPALTSAVVIDTPVSYLFDTVDNIDYYNMSVHVPGILPWGDIGLLCALSYGSVTFRSPRTMAGNQVVETALVNHRAFFERMGQVANQEKMTRFE